MGKGGVLPGIGVPPLFCPRMVLWHLGQKRVELSWWDGRDLTVIMRW